MFSVAALLLLSANDWKVVEEFNQEVAHGGPAAHFRLELDPTHDGGGEATRLRIRVPGCPELVIDNADGWIPYDGEPSYLASVYRGIDALRPGPSRFLLFARAARGGSTFVLVRSWGYASNAERLHVIGFGASGRPTVLFNQELDLAEYRDLDGNGVPEIIGRPCMSERVGSGSTYTPTLVFKIPAGNSSPARLSVALSKRLSGSRGRAWAGPKCSSELVVVDHAPGQREVVIDRDGKTVAVSPAKK